MVEKFCPKCGKSSKQSQFYNNFCSDCFLKDHPSLVSVDDVKLESCPSCLRVFLAGDWSDPSKIKDFLKTTVKTKELKKASVSVEEISCTEKDRDYKITVTGYLGSKKVTICREIKVLFVKKQCGICSKKQSHYHNVKIQLRSDDMDKLKKAFNLVRNENREFVKKDRMAEVFRFEVVKEGIDIYFGSAKAAKQSLKALSSLSKDIKKTYKLKGFDRHKNKKTFLVTVVVRL